jgi:hypothetical protein
MFVEERMKTHLQKVTLKLLYMWQKHCEEHGISSITALDKIIRMHPNPNERKRAHKLKAHLARGLLPTYRKLVTKGVDVVHDLGFKDVTSFIGWRIGEKASSKGEIREIIKSADLLTNSRYFELLDFFHEKLNDDFNFESWDLSHLQFVSEKPFMKYFTRKRIMSSVKETCSILGLAPQMSFIRIFFPKRKITETWASCFAVAIPSDIRIVVNPLGGFSDYQMFYHEFGHALHLASLENDQFEFKYIPIPLISESLALIFENILFDKEWIRKTRCIVEESTLKEFYRMAEFLELFTIRQVCAASAFEIDVYEDQSEIPEKFNEHVERFLGFPTSDPFDFCVNRTTVANPMMSPIMLIAILNAKKLVASFKERFGTLLNNEIGQLLRELYKFGFYYEYDELLRNALANYFRIEM